MARKHVLALCLVIISVSVMSHASASDLLNCAEIPFKVSGVCDGSEYREKSLAIEDALASLKASSDSDLSFLSHMAARAIERSLESCNNPVAIVPPFKSVAACVTSNLRLASSYVTKSSGKKMLLDFLKENRELDIAVVKKFPHQFLGITAIYFGDLHLGKGRNDNNLYGNLTDTNHTFSFSAQFINPNAQDIAFFEYGPCKQICASHWHGSFVSIHNVSTFRLSSQWND